MDNYRSAFAEDIRGMLAVRKTLGYASEPYEHILLGFDRYCVERNPKCGELTQSLIMPWLLKDDDNTKGISNRAAAIRFLAEYIQLSGRDAYILPQRYFGYPISKGHHVFSETELKNLFAAIDAYPESEKVPFSHLILPVFFRLAYTCGLRPQEVRNLKRENLNINTGEVLITETKKKKERLVVMSDDMLQLCRRYESMRQFFYADNPYFFPAPNGQPLDDGWLNRQLKKCWKRANPDIPKEQLPQIRIYDFRHSFASHNLNRWLDEGKDLMSMLPRLREYMGHYSLSETAYYIHLLPESLVKSRGIDWQALSDIIPEVKM